MYSLPPSIPLSLPPSLPPPSLLSLPPSLLPPSLPPSLPLPPLSSAQAQNHPTVHEQVQAHIPILQDFILKILQRLRDTIRDVPYGIRWLCKAIRALVQEKFPDVSAERMNSLIGGFFLLRYINPIIVAPYSMYIVLYGCPVSFNPLFRVIKCCPVIFSRLLNVVLLFLTPLVVFMYCVCV